MGSRFDFVWRNVDIYIYTCLMSCVSYLEHSVLSLFVLISGE